MRRDEFLADFKAHGRIVIVGASLAGLSAAETLRAEGFVGPLTIIGDEPDLPYDPPPLSKSVLTGWLPVDHTGLPRLVEPDAHWLFGVPATGLDLLDKRVLLADGQKVEYDRLLIATGTRARPWSNPAEAALDGVFTLRTGSDAARLRQRLAARPGWVLVIGGGFTGDADVAVVCLGAVRNIEWLQGCGLAVGSFGVACDAGCNIKSVGVPTGAEEVMIAQGSLDDARCVAVYGKKGRVVAAVSFDQAKWLEAYERLIEQAAPFPLQKRGVDEPTSAASLPAAFPEPRA